MAMAQMYLSAGPMVPDPEPLSFWGSKNRQKKKAALRASDTQQTSNTTIPHRRGHHDVQAVPTSPPTEQPSSIRALARMHGRSRSSRRASPPPPSNREPSPAPPLPAYALPSPPSGVPVAHARDDNGDEARQTTSKQPSAIESWRRAVVTA
ncbi:unnamed protein product [Peniophora sp. CBMAI 1063]|nr:unnamed protein product [Peniophora sp. CBMAI 1063]